MRPFPTSRVIGFVSSKKPDKSIRIILDYLHDPFNESLMVNRCDLGNKQVGSGHQVHLKMEEKNRCSKF